MVPQRRQARLLGDLYAGNKISARKRKHGRIGDAGTYIKPMLIQAALGDDPVRGRLQARYNRLVRRFGGDKKPGREEEGDHRDRAHSPQDRLPGSQERDAYQEPWAGFYTRRESPGQKQAWLERQLQKLHPGSTVTISPPEAALPPGA